ncbi:putative endoribonuclease l-psp protein [Phaeoacremonium minimum UCRPA7]|uniref:Putative endoribonuclease l-psp protein n=1 Tax=Phaeoacremonium minimum (strain UCR-PA7) TaxID=1286976 RepID=R8BI21_PHAM7|nr:putative endoribonuclease l-psp protein [Phaeoacremonium minimum UCRPA7]EON98956.1 putative endoribonuclease l-psp protein [Phaeoacremonium minimum UCRPA7]
MLNKAYCHSYDYKTGIISPDVAEQAEQCMKNIAAALIEAGAEIKDIVRVRYIVPDRHDFPKTWPVLQKWLGDVRPAATMIQAGLMEEAMKIEIEVTARKSATPTSDAPAPASAPGFL